jgi:hypothetical protein
MTALIFHLDERGVIVARGGIGVRACDNTMLDYELNVVAVDVADAVRYAGGWMCDRVRAGWKVNVYVPDDSNARPLQILGVRTLSVEDGLESLVTSGPAALAVAAEVVAANEVLRRYVTKILERNATEVTLWGDYRAAELDRHVDRVRHRLSTAAQAFKAEAQIAAGLSCNTPGITEEFHSCGLRYPPDGPDLMTVS